jgi:hypothetical protein
MLFQHMIMKILRFLGFIFKTYRKLIHFVFLHLIYIGIGISALLGKLSKKKFLLIDPTKTTWTNTPPEVSIDRMF